MRSSKTLLMGLLLLGFTVIATACAEETSNENGTRGNESEEQENEEENTGEEAAEITNDGVVYALQPISISAEDTVYEFTITNESEEEKELSFTTSQRYEYELRDQTNELVKRYSDDMAFMQVLEDIKLQLPALEPGDYTLTAFSVAKGLSGNQVTVTFSIEEE